MGQKPLLHSLPSSGVMADGTVTANHPVAGDEDGDLENRGVAVVWIWAEVSVLQARSYRDCPAPPGSSAVSRLRAQWRCRLVALRVSSGAGRRNTCSEVCVGYGIPGIQV